MNELSCRLVDQVDEKELVCINDTLKLNHLLYADDLVLMAHSVEELSRLVSVCEVWSKRTAMTFAPKKSFAMWLHRLADTQAKS